jgi:hypothetical protein
MKKDLYGLTDSGIAPELQAEYRGLTRNQAIQEAMLQQAMQAPGGVIDAGHFKVARSPLEGLGKVAQAYMARQGLNESDKKFAALGQKQTDLTADEVRRYQQMKTGTPEVPATPAVTDVAQTNQSMDTFDPQAAVAGKAAVPGNMRGAIDAFAASRSPVVQSMIARDYAAMTKPPVKTDLGDKWKVEYPDGRVMYESKSATPDAVLKEGGADKRFAGVSGNTQAQINADANNPNRPFTRGPDGQPVANVSFQNYEMDKAARGATRVSNTTTTNIDNGKKFYEELQKTVGDQVATTAANAKSAVGTLNTLGQIREALDSGKVIAGPGTTARQWLGQVGQVMGISGKDATDQLVQTRKAIQGLAQLELDAAQQMKGQGQITEAERAIIKRAAAGDIDGMSVAEIRMLTEVMDRSARSKISNNQSNVERLRSDPGAKSIISFIDIPMPPPYSGANSSSASKPPAATSGSGKTMKFDANGNLVQ